MKRVASYGLLVGSLLLAYQAFRNSQLTAETEAMAKKTACAVYNGCSKGFATAKRSDIVRHRYEFQTNAGGPVVVTCWRSGYFVGDWSCKDHQRGLLGMDRSY